MTADPTGQFVHSLKGIVSKPEAPVSVEDMTWACAEAKTPSSNRWWQRKASVPAL